MKFTVKVFDMPTVTDLPVMSDRKEAIFGRSMCNSLNNPFVLRSVWIEDPVTLGGRSCRVQPPATGKNPSCDGILLSSFGRLERDI